MFVVIAYRWGNTCEHNYLVTASADLDAIIKVADDECDNRGGKYGVTVWYVSEPHEKKYIRKVIKHFPSTCGEDSPYEEDMMKYSHKVRE